ncbi:unnamed protein product [Echinostoma caproni]|uniref:Acyl_transf_3 domain-containing protein n=1 Tax=Echinostoma caproni TaxID=27848 RepID=A0A183A9B7_9TREM|nr:unnamed protein product [Echinostoma caproni]
MFICPLFRFPASFLSMEYESHWILGVIFTSLLVVSSAIATFVVTYQNEYGPAPIPLRRVVSFIGCLVASVLTLSVVYGVYGHLSGTAPMSNMTASIYAALSRISFTIGIGIVIYLCATSWTPVIRSILCFSAFRVLARLTFCAYILHPIIILFWHYSLKETINMDYVYMTFVLFAVWSMSYLLAILFSAGTEIPVISFESLNRRIRKAQ